MIFALLSVAAVVSASQSQVPSAPGTIFSNEYRAARREYAKCLLATASRLAATEKDRLSRYGAYAGACSSERANMVDQFIRANEHHAALSLDGEVKERRRLFEQSISYANDSLSTFLNELDPTAPLE